MPDELTVVRPPRARAGCDDGVGSPCPSVPCDEMARLVLRVAGFPQGKLAERASAEGWTACRGPLGVRTVGAQRIDSIRGDPFHYQGVAPRYSTPRGASMKYWSGSSVEVHVEVESRALRPRPDCYWFGIDLLRFELVGSVLPGTGMEMQALQRDRRRIDGAENQDAFMWFNDLRTKDDSVYGLVPFNPTWLQSSVLRIAEQPYFAGCLPVVASGPGEETADEPCRDSPRRAGYFAPGELVTFSVPSVDSGRGQTTALTFAFASDLFFFTNELGRVLDRAGQELWARHAAGSFPLMWYNLGFEAVFVYRAWAIDHRGLKCNLWPFAVRAGLAARSVVPRRELPAELLSSTIPVLAEESAPLHYNSQVKNRFGGYVYEKPLLRGEYPADPEEPLSCVLGASSRVARLDLEIGPWPRLFALEAGPARLVVPELTDPGRPDAIPVDAPLLAVKWGANRVASQMAVLPDIAWGTPPFLALPLPLGKAVRFRKDTVKVDHDRDIPRDSAEGGQVGLWTEIVSVVLETDDGEVLPCEIVFLLERGLRCLPMPYPKRGGYEYKKVMAMQCNSVARVGEERAEFVFAPDVGQFGSPAFMAAHRGVVAVDGTRSYVNRDTQITYSAPEPPTERDCVWEETGSQALLRVLADFTPLAPLFLAYELYSGRSWASGIELSKTERIFAGVGVAVSILGHVGILRRLHAWRALRAEQKTFAQAEAQLMSIVDDFLVESRLSRPVNRTELLEFLEGASTLEDKHITVLEKVSEVMRKNPDARGGDALDAIRKHLSQAEMADYGEAAARITSKARARKVIALLKKETRFLTNREREVLLDFVGAGKLPAKDVGRLRVVGKGVVLEMSEETYATADALARRGSLVVVPGKGPSKAAAKEVFNDVLGFDPQAMGGKVRPDLLARSPREKVITLEVYTPKSRTLPDLGDKLKSPQAPYIVVEGMAGAPLREVRNRAQLILQRHIAEHVAAHMQPPRLLPGLSVMHGGALHVVPGSRELEEAFGYVVLGVVEQVAPVVGHAPVAVPLEDDD